MLAGLAISSLSDRPQRFDFRFSQGAFRDDEIFDSATCPPSRYLIELGRRLLRACPGADIFVIGNPLLPIRAERLAEWYDGGRRTVVATAVDKFPLFYVLPRRLLAELENFLLPLSMVDGPTDAKLLSCIIGNDVSCQSTNFPAIGSFPGITSTTWLNDDNKHGALKLQCEKAIEIMERRRDWKRVPFANFHPNHAGDILFFSIASHDVERPLYTSHIICSSYMDIWKACHSRLEPIRLRLPWLSRDYTVGEARYFAHALDRLGDEVVQNNYVIFTRFLRHYTKTPFHFIDHARFSLGDPMETPERTMHVRPPMVEGQCTLPASPLRVLVHLVGGGWALKAYPRSRASQLCRLLVALGCQVSVLDGPDLEAEGGRPIVADDTESLQTAIRAHHIVVGVDSYPQHFARNVMGWPTILLCGNTKSDNPGLRWGPRYRVLLADLPCNPCGSRGGCPLFGGMECLNYPSPQQVAATIFEMARTVYGASVAWNGEGTP